MLVAVLVLGIAFGLGRWVYVTIVVPRRIVAELRSMGAEFQYAKSSKFVPYQRSSPGDPPPVGYSVYGIHVDVPFESDDEAERANQLLRQLPPLGIVRLDHASNDYQRDIPGRLERADRHIGIVLRDVKTTVLVNNVLWPGEHTAAYCREATHLRSATFLSRGISVEELREICQAPQLEDLSLPDDEWTAAHLEVLETAPRLFRLRIGGQMPFDRLHAGLGRKLHFDLKLFPYWINDQDLKEYVAQLPNLTELSLEHHEPSDEALAALADAPRLGKLDLTDATVSDAALIALARSRSLEIVNLCGTNASNDAVLKLAECPTLDLLRIHDDQAKELQSLPKNVRVDWARRRSGDVANARAWRRAFVEKEHVAPQNMSMP